MLGSRLIKDVYTKDIAFSYFLPQGFAGVVTRLDAMPVIEPVMFNASTPPTYFGQVCVIDSNGIRVPTSSDTGVDANSNSKVMNGLLVRPFPTQQNSITGSVGSGSPNTTFPGNLPGNVLRRGYMILPLQNSTAAVKGARVSTRIASTSGTLLIGGIEATAADGTNTIYLPAYFMGPADSTGLVEVAYNMYATTE